MPWMFSKVGILWDDCFLLGWEYFLYYFSLVLCGKNTQIIENNI